MKNQEIGIEIERVRYRTAKKKQIYESTPVKKMKYLKELKESKLFLKEFLTLCSGEEFTQEIYIVKDKEGQYSARIPKNFAEATKIDPKNDRMLFRLNVPAALDSSSPSLKAEIIKGWNKSKSDILVKNIPEICNKIDSMVAEISKKLDMAESPFKNGELLMIAIMAQWKKYFKTQELADLTNQNWPTTNRYLQDLKHYNYVKLNKDKKGRERWAVNSNSIR